MGFVGKTAVASKDLPSWAGFMDRREYAEFRNLTDTWLRCHGREFEEADGGCVKLQLADGGMHVGLINLAQVCHRTPRDQWPEVISEHFGNTLLAVPLGDLTFGQAAPVLRVRAYPEGQTGPGFVTRRLAPGLSATLVLDFPKSIRAVIPSEVEKWGRPVDELFDLALAKVRAHERPTFQAPTSSTYGCVGSQGLYASTWVMMLEEFLRPVPARGALVTIPIRHLVLFEPIVDFSIVEAVPEMLEAAEFAFREGPGSVSPFLYWWRPGDLRAVAKLERGKVVVKQDDEFLLMLAELPPAPESAAGAGSALGRKALPGRPNRAMRRAARSSRSN